jgi:hypothetical protein
MDRKTPSVSDVVRRAVELCDPDDVDPSIGRLEQQFEDDDEPITAVENLEERMAIAVEGADYEAENPAVAVASALVFHLAAHPREVDSDEDPDQVIRRAVKAQWPHGAPRSVEDWLTGR